MRLEGGRNTGGNALGESVGMGSGGATPRPATDRILALGVSTNMQDAGASFDIFFEATAEELEFISTHHTSGDTLNALISLGDERTAANPSDWQFPAGWDYAEGDRVSGRSYTITYTKIRVYQIRPESAD
jgi:hypothetical protein